MLLLIPSCSGWGPNFRTLWILAATQTLRLTWSFFGRGLALLAPRPHGLLLPFPGPETGPKPSGDGTPVRPALGVDATPPRGSTLVCTLLWPLAAGGSGSGATWLARAEADAEEEEEKPLRTFGEQRRAVAEGRGGAAAA